MQHLIKTHNEIVEKLNQYEGVEYAEVEDFDDKLSAIKIITNLQIELKKLKEENKSGVVRVNRKGQILDALNEDTVTISELSKKFGITHRNVSSILCYLRKDGLKIGTARIGGETYVTLEAVRQCD